MAMKPWNLLWCILLAHSSATVVQGQDCIDYADYLHFEGSVDTPGYAVKAAVTNTRAYVADGATGLQIVDLSNPHSMVITGEVETPGSAWRTQDKPLTVGGFDIDAKNFYEWSPGRIAADPRERATFTEL
jgi:hypothetical protein